MRYTRLSLGLPPETIERIDEERGLVPRERWLRDLIETNLGGAVPQKPAQQPKPQPAPNPPQAPPPKPIVETKLDHPYAAVPGTFRCKVCGVTMANH